MLSSKRHRIEELEKEELLKLKKCVDKKNTKISIPDIYVIGIGDHYKIAKLEVTEFELGINLINWRLVLTDVFTGEVIHKKLKNEKLLHAEWDGKLGTFIVITPIYEIEPSLLECSDKKVSLDVLKNLYYRLNDVNKLVPREKSKIREK